MVAGRLSFCAALLVSSTASAQLSPLVDTTEASGSLTLGLSAARRARVDQRNETLALVTLTVPLERFAAPRPRFQLAEKPSRAKSQDAADAADAADGARDEGTGEPAAEPAAAEAPAPPPPRLSAGFARSTVRAALRTAGFPQSKRRMDSLGARAKSSAALPELRLRGGRTSDESLRLTPTTTDPYRYTQAGGTTLFFEARLMWRLDRLVFADAEIDVERLRRQHSQDAAKLTRDVLVALFAWQRARIRAADRALTDPERETAFLDQFEAEARLDVLTGGWFSEQLGEGG